MLLKTGTVTSTTPDEIELEQQADHAAIAFGGTLLDEGDDFDPVILAVGWADILRGEYRVAHSV